MADAKEQLKGWGRRAVAVVSILLSVAASVYVLRRAGVGPGAALRGIPPVAHVLALLFFAVEILARGARVWFVGRGLGLPLSLTRAVRAQLAGDAFGAVTPSKLGTEPAKITVLSRGGAGVGPVGALVVAEMASEFVVLVLLAGLILAVGSEPWWVAFGVAGYAATVVFGAVVALVAARLPGEEPPAVWRLLRLGVPRWHAVKQASREFRAEARRLRELPRGSVAAVLAAAVVHVAARIAILPALVLPAVAAAGTALPALGDLLLRPVFVLYTTVFLPLPGGGGGVELIFASVLGGTFSPAVLGVMLVWWRFYTFYLSALVGWVSVGIGAHTRTSSS